jgi:hypothetical protein
MVARSPTSHPVRRQGRGGFLHINDLCTSFCSQIVRYFYHNPSMYVNCVTIFFSHVLGDSINL